MCFRFISAFSASSRCAANEKKRFGRGSGGVLIGLLLCGILIGLGTAGLSSPDAAPLRIKIRVLENGTIRYAPQFETRVAEIAPRLNEGLGRLQTFFEYAAVRERPEFWLLEKQSEMQLILTHPLFGLKKSHLDRALRAGLYRDDRRIVFQLAPDTIDDWMLRVFYTEYARNLIDAVTPSVGEMRIGWLVAGMSSYLSWKIAGEQNGQNRDVYEEYMIRYYARSFDPQKVLPLELLEKPGNWEEQLRRHGSLAYSQAVLTYLHLAGLRHPRIGVSILRNYERDEAFSSAFNRATGMDLKDFEKDFLDNMIPRLRELRGGKGAAEHPVKSP